MDEVVYLLSLKNIKGIGDAYARKLIKKFGSPEEVFQQKSADLVQIGGITTSLAESIVRYDGWDVAEKEAEEINKRGARIIKFYDNDYPENLKQIYNYPLFLYYSGQINKVDEHALAVVGSRDCDKYGVTITENIVKHLASMGITIISGLARGIDTVAHKAAINSGGRTVAVLGNGIDICYPGENRELFNNIPENGYIVTEYPIGTEPDSLNFPKRNRLISGLSLGVIVVQANRKSGALITAEYAGEQNREVFAVPGNINNKRNSGTNRLIKSGAILIDNIDDITDEIPLLKKLNKKRVNAGNTLPELSGDENLVYQLLSDSELHIDQIGGGTNIRAEKLFELLLNMELKGIIKSMPGNYYKAC